MALVLRITGFTVKQWLRTSTDESDEGAFDYEHLLTELIHHFLIAMEPVSISKYTALITVRFHHHAPHSGPQDKTIYGKAIGKRVGGNHQQILGGKDEGVNPRKPKDCFSSADTRSFSRKQSRCKRKG